MELPEGKRLLVVAPAPIADSRAAGGNAGRNASPGIQPRSRRVGRTHRPRRRNAQTSGARHQGRRHAAGPAGRPHRAQGVGPPRDWPRPSSSPSAPAPAKRAVRDADSSAEWVFSSRLACNSCGREFRRPVPALFSFASPLGACPTCQGLRPRHGHRLRQGHPRSVAHTRRPSHRAVELTQEQTPLHQAAPPKPRPAVEQAARPIQRRRERGTLRPHSRILRLPGAQEVPRPVARDDRAISRLQHLPRLRRGAPGARRAGRARPTGGPSPTSPSCPLANCGPTSTT